MFFNAVFNKFYLNSNLYNKKISNFNLKTLAYKPSKSLLDCILKFEKKKIKIESLQLKSVWNISNLSNIEHKKLHSFFWLFSLDLKSSKSLTQSILLEWMEHNNKFNQKTWDRNILSKRIIAWITNAQLSYDGSAIEYKQKFNQIILKQANHLINDVNKSKIIEDKIICCTAIILTGLAYNEKEKFLDFGLNLLKKIISSVFDKNCFPRTRNISQLNFYLKYLILIREFLKESHNDIPEYLDEIIFYLGQNYSTLSLNFERSLLFNGSNATSNVELNNYLVKHGYKFKSNSNETGGYAILKNKKISLVMDIGPSPDKKFSQNYQCGALSFEITSNNKKLISNSGYFGQKKSKLNLISRSSATQNTLIIDDKSSCKINNKTGEIKSGLKILNKAITMNKDSWKIMGAHDGYNKNYGVIHQREIEFFVKKNIFVGTDKILQKNPTNINFEIRFHLEPDVKLMKTQDGKSIFIDIENEGWKFTCSNHSIGIETGLYFAKKNSYTQNQNMFISGMTNLENPTIKWELTKL